MRRPTFGSLFAGVGGFDLGFERAGWECRWQVEWDARCRSVLARHWPDVSRYEDVNDVYNPEPVDLITYGFPCQDLSVAGNRAGLDGTRSGLFFQATRIIREMREATGGRYPTWAVAENVPGLLSADGGHAMGRVLDELADCGAVGIEWGVVDAQHLGVAQRRRRVFIVACFDPRGIGADPLLPLGQGSAGGLAPVGETGARAAALTSNGVGTCGADDNQAQAGHLIPVAKVIRSGARDVDGNLPPEVWAEVDTAPTLNAFDNGGEARATGLAFHATQDPISSDEVAPALGARDALGVRRLTPRECERLQGFPDDWTRWDTDNNELADSVRYRQMGNAVAVPVAEWVARQLRKVAR